MAPFIWYAAIAIALAVGARGFTCPPVNYPDMAAAIPLAGGKVFLPIFRHRPQNRGIPKIAVIALHGAGRNGDNYHGWVTNAMHKQDMADEIVVITPTFADKNCSAAEWLGDPEAIGRSARWTHSTRQWVFGQKSDGYADFEGISSFEVVDDIIEWVEMTYKQIKKIVVTGFSAGAQMGLRWAILSPQGVKGTTLSGTPLTIILGSPSSVIYLNDRRPADSCSIVEDQTYNHNCTTFLVPGSSKEASKSCNGHYNRYPFGIDGLESGSAKEGTIRSDASEYVRKHEPDDSLIQDTLAAHFATKDIIFQFGNSDTKDCLHGACADDCSAMVEGTSRLQRGLNYMAHLRDAFPGYEPKYSIFNGGHRPELFFAGERFNEAVFDKTGWEECLWDSFTCFSLIWQCICGGVAFMLGSTGTGVYCCMKRSRDAETARQGYQKELQKELAAALAKVESGVASTSDYVEGGFASCGTKGLCCIMGSKK